MERVAVLEFTGAGEAIEGEKRVGTEDRHMVRMEAAQIVKIVG